MKQSELKAKLSGSTADFAEWITFDYVYQLNELLHSRNNLNRDDLEYVVEQVAKLKDERLKQCVTTLIGWGDEERAELETFLAVAIEVMRHTPPSRLRMAATTVNIRFLMP